MAQTNSTTDTQLCDKYLRLEAAVADGHLQVPEPLRLRLYGLAKQVKEGDCRKPQPPSSNEILSGKWLAWTACAGMSVERAMLEYVGLIETLEPSVKSPKRKSHQPLVSAEEIERGIKKQGTLYKQRDVFKGWRPRHFVLQDRYLHYYLEADDPVPRNTLDLSGCMVTTGAAVEVDGTKYYPFTISHPKSKVVYNLASDSKHDSDVWVAKVIEAASSISPSSNLLDDENIKVGEVISTNPRSDSKMALNPGLTKANVPAELAGKIDKNVNIALDLLEPDNASKWELLIEKQGVVAKRIVAPYCFAKAEIMLPFSFYDVIEVLTDMSREKEWDPTKLKHERLVEFSKHTFIDYLALKGLWPLSARDCVLVVHSRVLVDGTYIICVFSEPAYDYLKPTADGLVRMEVSLSAYTVNATPEGTRVRFFAKLGQKGGFPLALISYVCTDQAMTLASLKKLMENDRAKKGLFKRPLSTAVNYQDVLTATKSFPGAVPLDQLKRYESKVSLSNDQKVGNTGKLTIYRKATLLRLSMNEPALRKFSLIILFLGPLLFYVVESRFRSAAFLLGCIISFNYFIKQFIGNPMKKKISDYGRHIPRGNLVFRFPIDLGSLLTYLDKKRADHEMEITFTHLAAKACAMVLNEMPSMNGHSILGSFYRHKEEGVDVSVAVDVNERETLSLKIVDADAKPLEYIANEVINGISTLRSGDGSDTATKSFYYRLEEMMPNYLSSPLKEFFYTLGATFGFEIKSLGVSPYPLGVCHIASSPSSDGETDVDIAYIPEGRRSSAPINVTLGGLRILPSLDADRKPAGNPVLNVAIVFDTLAASHAEGRKFCSRFQRFMNDPSLLDTVHTKAEFDRQEALKRKQYFGS